MRTYAHMLRPCSTDIETKSEIFLHGHRVVEAFLTQEAPSKSAKPSSRIHPQNMVVHVMGISVPQHEVWLEKFKGQT